MALACARHSAWAWHRGDPGHAFGGASAVAGGPASRDPDGGRAWPNVEPRDAALYLPDQSDVPAVVADDGDRDGEAICANTGRDRLADRQRIYAGQFRPVLLQVLSRGISAVAARAVSHARCAEPGVGHGLLEQYVYGFCT